MGNIPDGMTREEYRDHLRAMLNEKYGELPPEDAAQFDAVFMTGNDKASLIARARKAFVAAGLASFGVFGAGIIQAGSDGVIDWAGEIAPVGIIAASLAVGTWFATYWTPNAEG